MGQTRRGEFTAKDIKALRQQIQVGDVVREAVYYDRTGERLEVPIRKRRRVKAKYPHLVELEAAGNMRRTLTYVDILLGQGKRREEEQC